jgi:type IV pilus assembly protein PilQ
MLNITRNSGRIAIGAFLVTGLATGGAAWAATKINSIDFQVQDGENRLQIRADGPLIVDKQENPEDKQIVLEIQDAQLAPYARRRLDTSSFNSNISLISPYQVDGGKATRIVIQMKDMAKAEVSQNGNALSVRIPMSQAAALSPTAAEAPIGAEAAPAAPLPADAPAATNGAAAPAGTAAGPAGEVAQVNRGKKGDLESFIEAQATRRFVGRPITLQLRDADLADVFRLIGESSGFNIIVSAGVAGKISLSLVDVPWDQALDLILQTQQLAAERSNNVLRILPLADFTREKKAELDAKLAAEASAPRVTRIFPINYAKLSDLVQMLSRFGTSQASAAAGAVAGAISAGATPANSEAVVQSDERTNSIIVRDTAENIERMKKLIDLLDTQTPQVVIESKIVEATENFSRSLSGSLGLGSAGSSSNPSQFFASFSGANPIDPLVGGTTSPFTDGSAIAQAAANNSTSFGLSPSISFIPGIQRLNAFLSIGETESKVRVVSSPRVVVLNKEKANITSGQPVLVPKTQVIAGVGTTQGVDVQTANLSLGVTPTVTNEGSILMDLNITRDIPTIVGDQTLIAPRTMTTKVMVDSGTTLVIGGIYSASSTMAESGIPFFRKIPILGALFGAQSGSTARSELFIFINPRVLNEKEAGLTGG